MQRDCGARRPSDVARPPRVLGDHGPLRCLLNDIEAEADRARRLYDCSSSWRRNHAESPSQQEELAHRRAQYRSSSAPINRQKKSSKTSGGRRSQHRLSSASPHHAPASKSGPATCGPSEAFAKLVDVWRPPPRRSLLGDHLKHYPYVANSDFHKPNTSTLEDAAAVRQGLDAIARTLRSNVDVALTLYRNGSWAA